MVRMLRLSLACLLLAVVGTRSSDAHLRKGSHNQERGPGGAPHEDNPYSKHPSIALINAPGENTGATGDDNGPAVAFANMVHEVFGWDVSTTDNQKDSQDPQHSGRFFDAVDDMIDNVLDGAPRLKEDMQLCEDNKECISGCCTNKYWPNADRMCAKSYQC